MQCQKRVNIPNDHLAKATITAVYQMLQEGQADAVTLETPRREEQ